jgi:hypothetical protein
MDRYQSRRGLWEVWLALARCAEALGDAAEAARCHEKAQTEIRWVVSQIDEENLRAGFLRNAQKM